MALGKENLKKIKNLCRGPWIWALGKGPNPKSASGLAQNPRPHFIRRCSPRRRPARPAASCPRAPPPHHRAAQAHAPAEAAPRRCWQRRHRARGPRHRRRRLRQVLLLLPAAAEGPLLRLRGLRDRGRHPHLQVRQLQGGRRAAAQVRVLARPAPAAAALAQAAGPARDRRWVGRQDDARGQVRCFLLPK